METMTELELGYTVTTDKAFDEVVAAVEKKVLDNGFSCSSHSRCTGNSKRKWLRFPAI